MPTMVFRNSVAAGATVTNVLAGSTFEFLKNLARIDVGIVSDATDGTALASIQFGPEVQMEEGPVPAEPGAGQGPRVPEDIIVSDAAAAGDRLVIRLRNTHATTARVFRTLVRVRPIA